MFPLLSSPLNQPFSLPEYSLLLSVLPFLALPLFLTYALTFRIVIFRTGSYRHDRASSWLLPSEPGSIRGSLPGPGAAARFFQASPPFLRFLFLGVYSFKEILFLRDSTVRGERFLFFFQGSPAFCGNFPPSPGEVSPPLTYEYFFLSRESPRDLAVLRPPGRTQKV